MTDPMPAGERVGQAIAAAEADLVRAGDWLSGPARRQAWLEARDAATNELDRRRLQAVSPNAVEGKHAAAPGLDASAVEVVHRVASDPGRLSQSWAREQIAALGDTVYTELVGVTAIAATVDTFHWAMNATMPTPAGSLDDPPSRVRPDDVGDVGAWVPQAVELANANVSRSLSLVPVTNRTWGRLVDALYSRGSGFFDLQWTRALSRPQVELVAARTTAELECFY